MRPLIYRAPRLLGRGGYLLLSTVIALVLLAFFAIPESKAAVNPNATAVQFSIAPQPLLTAIEAFGKTTKAQIIYDSAIVAGRRSQGVQGSHTPIEALALLLAGTGLIGGYQGPDSLVLVVQAAELPNVAAPAYMPDQRQPLALDTLRVEAGPIPEFFFRSYALLVQSGIQRALQNDDEAGNRPLRIKVWLDANGTIRQSALFVSSGNQRTDAEILRRVQGLALQIPPPAGFPQPVHIRIRD
jgi:TonB family protein